MPKVYEYEDYRDFLRAAIESLRAKGDYSNRDFAKRAGFKAHNFITLVLAGKRNLGPDSSFKVAHALGLDKNETLYFETLVEYCQTKDLRKKDEIYKQLLERRESSKLQKLSLGAFNYLSHWYHPVLRELLSTEHSTKTSSELAKLLDIETEQVEESLALLQMLGLVENLGDRWYSTEEAVQIPTEVRGPTVRNYHRRMIEKALASVDQIESPDRNLSSLTMALNREDFHRLTEMVSKFREEVLSRFSESKNADQVYQINFQIFPFLKKN